MEKTEDALSQILEILETRKGSFSIKHIIASIVSGLVLAIILGIFAWSTSIGKTNNNLSLQIHDLSMSVETSIKEQNSRHQKLREDINYNNKIISDKLNITLKELQ